MVGKAAVVGSRDQKTGKVSASAVTDTKTKNLQDFVAENAAVYTDEAAAYQNIPFNHKVAKHRM